MFRQEIAKIETSYNLEKILKITEELNLQEMQDQFKLRVKDYRYLSDITNKAIESNDQKQLEDALKYAIEKNIQEVIDKILLKVTYQERLEFVKYATDKNNREIIDQILLKVTYEERLEFLKYAIDKNNQEMFAQLLPRVGRLSLEDALKYAIEKNNQEIIDQILPEITDQQGLGKFLRYAIDKNNQEMFAKLLPKVIDKEQLGKTLASAVSSNNQEMFDQLLPRIAKMHEYYLSEAFESAVSSNNQKMFNQLLPKVTYKGRLGKALESAVFSNNQEMFNQLLSRVDDLSDLDKAHSAAKKMGHEIMANLIYEKQNKIFAINHPWLASIAKNLRSANDWMKSRDPIKLGNGAEESSIPTTEAPLFVPSATGDILSNSVGALPSSNPTDKPAPAQAAGPSWQNIGAQVALAAVAGALVYGAGKYAYDLYKRNTGPDAKPEDIEQATILLKKVAKFDPKELSKISQEFKTHADQITDRLNDLYDARKSNSEEYKDLREQLDKVTANQDAISTLQNSMKAMKLEAKHFVAPKYALKEGYVGGIIKECANIQDICEKLGVSMAKSPKSHAQKVMAEREGKSAGDKAL